MGHESEFYKDIHWWIECIDIFHGKSLILDNKPITSVETDACRTGAGLYYEGDWGYINFHQYDPQCSNTHKPLFACWLRSADVNPIRASHSELNA